MQIHTGDFKGAMADLLPVILKAYQANGESELATRKRGRFLTARYGSVGESKGKLGALANVREAFRRIQAALYLDRSAGPQLDCAQSDWSGRILGAWSASGPSG